VAGEDVDGVFIGGEQVFEDVGADLSGALWEGVSITGKMDGKERGRRTPMRATLRIYSTCLV
jgi:hypothetical protein